METQQSLATLGSIIVFAGVLALFNERLNELLIMPFLTGGRFEKYKAHVALVIGTVIGIVSGVDFLTPLAALFGVTLNVPWAGLALSGIIIGGGSNFLHDLVGSWGGGRTSIATTGPTAVTVNQPEAGGVTSAVHTDESGAVPTPPPSDEIALTSAYDDDETLTAAYVKMANEGMIALTPPHEVARIARKELSQAVDELGR